MESRQDITKRVEQALSGLDGIRRASPGPYFYTRLRARMEAEPPRTAWERMGMFLGRPAIALAVVLLILASNTVLLFNHTGNRKAATATQALLNAENGQAGVQNPENAYDLASNSNTAILNILDRENE
ncbi:MAG TPA: hypothetical protein VG870_01075 [Chitinophagaceae bacterium]|nr:hypothetical protein [Chitinophagaceae bacterium]